MPQRPLPDRIVSGGQTGVDRAALDAARQLEIEHGGWCPKGRRAEDGPIPAHYDLRETSERDYSVRTERNVLDSDGTLILFSGRLQGGSWLTKQLAERHAKPLLLVDLVAPPEMCGIRDWILKEQIHVLNVAGPRESSLPGIGERAKKLLLDALEPQAS